jgi:hypothetical protein
LYKKTLVANDEVIDRENMAFKIWSYPIAVFQRHYTVFGMKLNSNA